MNVGQTAKDGERVRIHERPDATQPKRGNGG
jgi:hypothetical protein